MYVAVFVLILIVSIAFYFYHSGKKTTTLQAVPGDVPGSHDANNNPAGASNTDILELANELHQDMKGTNFFGHNNDLFSKLLTYSDTDFVRLYNAFNTLYQQEGQGTFIQWVKDETNVTGNFITLKDAILDRGAKLNLQ